jgi:hypothetical protein
LLWEYCTTQILAGREIRAPDLSQKRIEIDLNASGLSEINWLFSMLKKRDWINGALSLPD